MARPNWLARDRRAKQSFQIVPRDTMTQSLTQSTQRELWTEIVTGYMATLNARTRMNYTTAIRRWDAYCLIHNVDPVAVTRKHIDVWMRHLIEEESLNERTVSGYVGTICSLYAYAHSHEMISANPGAYVLRPRPPRVSTALAVTPQETGDLLDAAEEAEPWLDAFIHILALNGTRWSETRFAQIEHLGMHGEIPTLHLPRRKGGGVSTLALAEPTWRAVQRAAEGRTTGTLYVHDSGQGVGRKMMRRRFAELVASIGVDRRITPHSLRHGFVTMSLDAGCHIRDIMASTGHADPSMVMYYDRARAAIERNTTHSVADWIQQASQSTDRTVEELSDQVCRCSVRVDRPRRIHIQCH